MRDQKRELHFSEKTWPLFKLTCNQPCCDSGDAVYYCATYSQDPSSTYAVKVGHVLMTCFGLLCHGGQVLLGGIFTPSPVKC